MKKTGKWTSVHRIPEYSVTINVDESDVRKTTLGTGSFGSGKDKRPLPAAGQPFIGQVSETDKDPHISKDYRRFGYEKHPNPYAFSTTIEGDLEQNWTTSWRIGPPQPLKAVIDGPLNVIRGEPILLSGSESTGPIKSFKWTFNTKGKGNDKATINGIAADVTLLDETTVTLTVTGFDGKTDKATHTVWVMPRRDGFETPFEILNETNRPMEVPVIEKGDGDFKDFQGGVNECFCNWLGKERKHWLHPDPVTVTADKMFSMAIVEDEGPFNGYFYLEEWKMIMKRVSVINTYILPGADVILSGNKNFYDANAFYPTIIDMAGYLEKRREHEEKHSELAKKALDIYDPAEECEKYYAKTTDELIKKATDHIKKAENSIHEKAADPLRTNWGPAPLMFFNVLKKEWESRRTQIGEDGGKW
jgi:hypothetical protein